MKATTLFTVLLSFFFLSSATLMHAQQGTVRGTISDKETGEPLMFTNVFVKNTDPPIGTQTDLDGNYALKLEPGTYTLEVSYVGYALNTITDVQVSADSITILDFLMEEETETLQEVVVQADRIDRTENALLLLQKKATTIQDGISAQEISRFGSSNAAESMKRVTGASVVDGKYVFVRGLGDRYSSAQLNGQQLPSTDPYRNQMQLDLIPANLLDNIIASKTFTPDQPGNFTGGNINLQTKAFPERFTLSAGITVGFNDQSSLRDNFLTEEGGDWDWLGFDDGTRDFPAILQDSAFITNVNQSNAILARRDSSLAFLFDEAADGMNPNRSPSTKTSGLNHAVNFSIGNQFEIGQNPLGVLVGINYRKNFDFYDNGRFAYWELTDQNAPELNLNRDLNDARSQERTQLGGMASLSYKIGGNNKISFITIYNHIGRNDARILDGPFPAIISGNGTFQTEALRWQERSFLDLQLSGEHVFGENGIKLEWGGSYVRTVQDDPDFRQFTSTRRIINNDTTFAINPSEVDLPFTFFRELEDDQYNGKIDLTIPFAQAKSKFNSLKFGGFYATKDRFFRDNVIQTETGDADPYTGDPDVYFADENTGIISQEGNRFRIGLFPFSFARSTNENSYDGNETITAFYGMVNYDFEVLKVIAGMRAEITDISIENLAGDVGQIEATDFLPSVNLIYPIGEDMNLRGSFSRTLARPNMRELAPFVSFDFGGDFRIQGNPDLDRTLINNFDLRWEWFPRPGEVIAVSTYYKDFFDPIVTTFLPQVSNPIIEFQNVEEAEVYGVEFEFRKRLDFLSDRLYNWKIITNLSFIQSEVDIPDEEQAIIDMFNPEKGSTRPLQGQSDYLINAAINYVNPELDIDAILAFNVFGERLDDISEGTNPDIYEQPRPQLDFSFSKGFGENIGVKLSAQNLLNPDFRTFMEFRGNKFDITRFRTGRVFSVKLTYSI